MKTLIVKYIPRNNSSRCITVGHQQYFKFGYIKQSCQKTNQNCYTKYSRKERRELLKMNPFRKQPFKVNELR
ncbi:MAG: hypothetical protein WA667_27590 [Candidatus Nitrosopolaris sp.]